jgi:hypothetical protein
VVDLTKEPTPEIVVSALSRAKFLMGRNNGWDLLKALAEATTSTQCGGVAGYKVFRDVRAAVTRLAPQPLPDYSRMANRAAAIALLEKTIQIVKGMK